MASPSPPPPRGAGGERVAAADPAAHQASARSQGTRRTHVRADRAPAPPWTPAEPTHGFDDTTARSLMAMSAGQRYQWQNDARPPHVAERQLLAALPPGAPMDTSWDTSATLGYVYPPPLPSRQQQQKQQQQQPMPSASLNRTMQPQANAFLNGLNTTNMQRVHTPAYGAPVDALSGQPFHVAMTPALMPTPDVMWQAGRPVPSFDPSAPHFMLAQQPAPFNYAPRAQLPHPHAAEHRQAPQPWQQNAWASTHNGPMQLYAMAPYPLEPVSVLHVQPPPQPISRAGKAAPLANDGVWASRAPDAGPAARQADHGDAAPRRPAPRNEPAKPARVHSAAPTSTEGASSGATALVKTDAGEGGEASVSWSGEVAPGSTLAVSAEHFDDNEAATTTRICTNCHTTSTNSWRRGGPTKVEVLCNRCGLFWRDHLQHRPNNVIGRPMHIPRVVRTRPPSAGLCKNCGMTSSPTWRRGPHGIRLCNACGIYWQQQHELRPIGLALKMLKNGPQRRPRRRYAPPAFLPDGEQNDSGRGSMSSDVPLREGGDAQEQPQLTRKRTRPSRAAAASGGRGGKGHGAGAVPPREATEDGLGDDDEDEDGEDYDQDDDQDAPLDKDDGPYRAGRKLK